MTVQEADKIIEILEMAYPNIYKNRTDKQRLDNTKTWAVCLVNDNFDDIKTGLLEFIKTDRSQFPPSIGQLRGIAEDYAKTQYIQEFFQKAVRKSMGMLPESDGVSGYIGEAD